MRGFYSASTTVKTPAQTLAAPKVVVPPKSDFVPIRTFAQAIAACEGFYKKGGSIAQRRNNPGNIRINGAFVKYKTVEDGWNALEESIRGFMSKGVTLSQMMMIYSPAVENDTANHTNCIAQKAGIEKGIALTNLIK